jgi:hypothetical protein
MSHPRAGLLKKYKQTRAVEVALSGPMHSAVTDAALNFAARRLQMTERGEALYEHDDFGVLLELATYHHRLRGKTIIERTLDKTDPAPGSAEHRVLTAMIDARFTLLELGEPLLGVGVEANDLLFGGKVFLADIPLSKRNPDEDQIIAAHVLAFDDFVMTPCTSYLDFDREAAELLAEGLPTESKVPMAKRFAGPEARVALAADLMDMALCTVESVTDALRERFGVS